MSNLVGGWGGAPSSNFMASPPPRDWTCTPHLQIFWAPHVQFRGPHLQILRRVRCAALAFRCFLMQNSNIFINFSIVSDSEQSRVGLNFDSGLCCEKHRFHTPRRLQVRQLTRQSDFLIEILIKNESSRALGVRNRCFSNTFLYRNELPSLQSSELGAQSSELGAQSLELKAQSSELRV